jgi:phosphoribosylanthranilate isomerase
MDVKICGITDPENADAACQAGATMLGFVFYPPSPRAIAPAAAGALIARLPADVRPVGLFVDATEEDIAAVLGAAPLGMLQLHGAESPARCAELRARFGLPVMKALGIAEAADLDAVAAYAPVVDWLLLDAKPPPGASRPGGNAAVFDWSLLAGRAVPRPWLLAGGLVPGNVADAIRATGAPGVDVSSGVERARGVKDAGLIRAFIQAALEPVALQPGRGEKEG